jgi:23S rRNA (guanosine2251-2'-O)-methyltransferase
VSDWVYGFHAVEALLRREPKAITVLWLETSRRDKRAQSLLQLAADQGVAVERVTGAALDNVATGRHQGIAVKVNAGAVTDAVDEAGLLALLQRHDSPLLLILDGVTDPHNLGACLRTADAAGVTAVVVPQDGAASLSPVARKVACGAADTVPFVRVTNLSRTLGQLKEAGVWLIGTSDKAPRTLFEQDFSGPLAIVMGAEGAGMRRLTEENCDFLVSLPMQGSVSSLNVSVATGICLFEAVRQRNRP